MHSAVFMFHQKFTHMYVRARERDVFLNERKGWVGL